MNVMIYKERLKEIREVKNLSQKELAQKLNITTSGYSRYENENDIFPLKHLITTSSFLNISLDYIFGFNNILNYPNNKLNTDNKETGLRIKNFRKENNLTQEKLAKILNIGNGTLADYERGRYLISTHALYEICKKYKISADYLLGKIDEPKYLK